MRDLLLSERIKAESGRFVPTTRFGAIAFLAYPGINQRELVFGTRGEARNGADWSGNGRLGSAYRSTAATHLLRYAANTSTGDNQAGRFFTGSTAHTFFVGLTPTGWGTGTGQNSVFGLASGTTLRMAFGRANPTDGHCRYFGSDGTTGFQSGLVNNVIVLGSPQIVVCRRDGAAIDFFRNGQLIGSSTVTNTAIGLGAPSSVNNGWAVLNRGYTSTADTRGFIGSIWFLCALPFAASNTLIAWISDNPLLLADPVGLILPFDLAPQGGTTVDRSISDRTFGQESANATLTVNPTVGDTGRGRDAVTPSATASPSVADTTRSRDTAGQSTAITVGVADIGRGRDSVADVVSQPATVSDTTRGRDSVAATTSTVLTRSAADTTRGTDAIAATLAQSSTVNDTTRGRDAARATTGVEIQVSAIDATKGLDSVAVSVAVSRSASDTTNGQAAIATAVSVSIRASDTTKGIDAVRANSTAPGEYALVDKSRGLDSVGAVVSVSTAVADTTRGRDAVTPASDATIIYASIADTTRGRDAVTAVIAAVFECKVSDVSRGLDFVFCRDRGDPAVIGGSSITLSPSPTLTATIARPSLTTEIR